MFILERSGLIVISFFFFLHLAWLVDRLLVFLLCFPLACLPKLICLFFQCHLSSSEVDCFGTGKVDCFGTSKVDCFGTSEVDFVGTGKDDCFSCFGIGTGQG